MAKLAPRVREIKERKLFLTIADHLTRRRPRGPGELDCRLVIGWPEYMFEQNMFDQALRILDQECRLVTRISARFFVTCVSCFTACHETKTNEWGDRRASSNASSNPANTSSNAFKSASRTARRACYLFAIVSLIVLADPSSLTNRQASPCESPLSFHCRNTCSIFSV